MQMTALRAKKNSEFSVRHYIRLLGNEAAHDEKEPEQQEIDDLANLTRMTLVYLFEMPERVRRLREKGNEAI
jgi:Domain of unknown function (DUF4145)